MATAYTVPAILRVKRSAQSAAYAMTAAWQVVYTNSSLYAWLFASAEIDLTPMILGDTIEIRTRKIITPGGGWIVHHQATYNDVQPANHPSVHVGPLLDVYGIEVAMRQTAGVLANIDCEFFDAFR